jgi:hypothetical protein
VMAAALTPSEQRSLLGFIARLQHAARQAQSTPAPQAAARRRRTGPSGDAPTLKGTPP